MVDLVGAHPGEGLRDRGVLGVHGQDLPGRGGTGDERAAHHEGLLVREGEPGAGVEGGEGGLQADRAGDGVEDHVPRAEGARERGDLVGPRGDARQRCAGLAGGGGDRRGHGVLAGGVRDDETLGAVREDLRGDELRAGAADGETVHPGGVRVALDDVEGLGADGSRGAQQDQPA